MSESPYERLLGERIRQAVSAREQPLNQIIRSCRGAYPTTVFRALQNLNPEIAQCSEKVFEIRPMAEENRVTMSVLAELEGNPVLSSWYFTPSTCSRIEGLRDWSTVDIVFLGTPRVYEWFAVNRIGARRTLVELDKLVIERLRGLSASCGDEILTLDICDSMPDRLAGQFQAAVLDPPWYPQDYEIWIRQAKYLAPGGLLCLSLFPELTRPSAEAERSQVLRDLTKSSRGLITLTDYLEYEIPSFELYQLKASGIDDLRPWKLSDLVVCELGPSPKLIEALDFPRAQNTWREVGIGKLRIFVGFHETPNNADVFLSHPQQEDVTLPSPSRRIAGFGSMNVLTSHGDGLVCSRPSEFLEIVSKLSIAISRGRQALAAEIQALPMDDSSRRLLKRIIQFE
jgi:hypothetical protein